MKKKSKPPVTKITSFFKPITRDGTFQPSIGKNLNKIENISHDSDDDCIIIEKQTPFINLVDPEDILSDVEKNNEKSNHKDNTINNEDSNGYEEIVSSQEVETIPDDDLDESFITCYDSDDTISLSLEETFCHNERNAEPGSNLDNSGSKNIRFSSDAPIVVNENAIEIMESFCQTNEHPKKQMIVNKSVKVKRRVIIKRDYITSFMVHMVNRFMSSKDLHHLFNERDFNIIKAFHKLKSAGAQILFSRLYWLTPTYKVTSKIVEKYLKVNFKSKAINEMINKLKFANLLSDEQMDIETWCDQKSRSELIFLLKPVLKHVKLSSMSKPEIIEAVTLACTPKNDISKHFIKSTGKPQSSAVKLLIEKHCKNGDHIKIHSAGKAVFDRLHLLMYTGLNPQILRDKKLNLLLLNIKQGLQHYPSTELKHDSLACIFPTRAYFEAYVNAYAEFEKICNKLSPDIGASAIKCWEELKNLSKSEEISQFNPHKWHHRFSPFYVYYKTIEHCVPSMRADNTNCNHAVAMLKKMLAEKKCRAHKISLWYTELVMCLWKMRQHKEAADVLAIALTDSSLCLDDKAPLCDKAQRLAQMKAAKLNAATRNKLLELSHQIYPEIPHVKICGKMMESEQRNRRVKYRIFDEASGSMAYTHVEDLAIHHYVTKLGYTQGEHWENSIITCIFALVFWDVIYCDLPGKAVFVSPYQELPLDIFTPHFYDNRKNLIDQRLEFIRMSKITDTLQTMKTVFQARKEGDFSMYNDKITWDSLCDVVTCLDSSGLHAICMRLAHSFYRTHSGFPDLTVWDVTTKKIKFVEVKSHNDRLSFKQIKWMQYLIENGIDTEVCFVSPSETDMDVSSKINRQSSGSMQEALLRNIGKKNPKHNTRVETADKELFIKNNKTKTKCKIPSKKQNSELEYSLAENNEQDQSKSNPLTTNKRKSPRIACEPKKKMKKVVDEMDANKNDVAIVNDAKTLHNNNNFISNNTRSKSNRNVKNLSVNRKKNSAVEASNIVKKATVTSTKIDSTNVSISPKKMSTKSNNSPTNVGVYLRTPTKYSKGAGYFVSPGKSECSPSEQSRSPYKNLSPKRKISLSLTRRRLTDLDK